VKRSPKVVSIVMALSATVLAPQASARTTSGTTPQQSTQSQQQSAQQQNQTQQPNQTQKQKTRVRLIALAVRQAAP
jgi:hypothetical protein